MSLGYGNPKHRPSGSIHNTRFSKLESGFSPNLSLLIIVVALDGSNDKDLHCFRMLHPNGAHGIQLLRKERPPAPAAESTPIQDGAANAVGPETDLDLEMSVEMISEDEEEDPGAVSDDDDDNDDDAV